jgi:hypothetical protein
MLLNLLAISLNLGYSTHMRTIMLCFVTLVSVAGCSNPKPVAQLDMSNYWYSASTASPADMRCQTVMTVSGGNKVKCSQ